MSMARLNLSHGTLKQNLKLLNKFKQAKRLRPHKSCGFMVELRGREIRISKIMEASNQMKIRAGSIVNLIAGQYDQPSDANNFRINTSEMQKVLKPNDVIYFDDGKVIGIIIDIQPSSARMEIKIGGVMKGCSQVRFTSGKHVHLAPVTNQDIYDLS